ncbi:MAG: DUF4037 domain-containing protein [Candidatus Thorarchaeota archaeon SMTZ1-45]|nr:MAG: hypothetical protein AM325_11700 [Candidatus Thorarchaeota archaeon SMTZ1-45]
MNPEYPSTKHFVKGLDLSQVFYEEAVRPLLESEFPDLAYSAGHLGAGSDVLGFDTEQSMDHDWGPKLLMFLGEKDHEKYHESIDTFLGHNLPTEIRGLPVNFGYDDDGAIFMQRSDDRPLNHRVKIVTIGDYFERYLTVNPLEKMSPIDWVVLPEQRLRSIAGGRIFHDGLGKLQPIMEKLSYYPNDVWLYLLSTQWRRIAQEEHFMGRCGQVGDELGSRVVGSRLVYDIMKLCFLMEKQYTPYIKWFGTGFSQLKSAAVLTPILMRVFEATSWKDREEYLVRAYEVVAGMHNDLNITEPMKAKVSNFHTRPFLVIGADDFAEAIYATIQDEEVLSLSKFLGGVDQFVNSTDVLSKPKRYPKLRNMFASLSLEYNM